MAKHLVDGSFGEQLARDYLRSIGYTIVHCNWRYRHLEIDIIALDRATFVFVEVKSRHSTRYGQPYEFVDYAK